VEDLRKENAKIYHKHQVRNILEKESIQTQSLFIFKHRKPENTKVSRQILYHNTNAAIHANHSTMNSLAQDETEMEKEGLFVINQEVSNTEA
jgi:hypothetical protein